MRYFLGAFYLVAFVLSWLAYGWTLALLVFVCYFVTVYVLDKENLL